MNLAFEAFGARPVKKQTITYYDSRLWDPNWTGRRTWNTLYWLYNFVGFSHATAVGAASDYTARMEGPNVLIDFFSRMSALEAARTFGAWTRNLANQAINPMAALLNAMFPGAAAAVDAAMEAPGERVNLAR